MFRIGILGSENSHAEAFTRIFNRTMASEYPDIQVTAIGGSDRETSQKIFHAYDLSLLAEQPEDMLGQVDAIMITARHGDQHLPFAQPFLQAGIPAFIDKPFACTPEDALELVRLSKQKHVPLIGGSSVKYAEAVQEMKKSAAEAMEKGEPLSGDISAPVSMQNAYGNFYFYASHLVEISLTIFGYDPAAVTAFRRGDNITAVMQYDRYAITNRFLNNNYHYTVLLNTVQRPLFREVNISSIYQHECNYFARMLRTGRMEQSYDELLVPVFCMQAIEQSYQNGTCCTIEKPVM